MAVIEKLSDFFSFFEGYRFLGIANLSIHPLEKEGGSAFDLVIKKWKWVEPHTKSDVYNDRYTAAKNLLVKNTETIEDDALLSFKVQSTSSDHKNVAIFESKNSEATHLVLCFYKPFEIHSFWSQPPTGDVLKDLPQVSYETIHKKIRQMLLGKSGKKLSQEKSQQSVKSRVINRLLSYDVSLEFIIWLLSAFGYKKHEITTRLKFHSTIKDLLENQEDQEQNVSKKLLSEAKQEALENLPPGLKNLFIQVKEGGIKMIGILENAPNKSQDSIQVKSNIPKKEEKKEGKALPQQAFPSQYFYAPHFIEIMNRHVVGQEEAKKTLAVVLCKHFRRLALMDKGIELEKNNLLMVGPSGTGKTSLIKTITENLDIPYIKVDANSLTQTGYVGRNVSDVFVSLIKKVGGNLKKAEESILVIDEIDKIRSFNDDTLEVSNKSVQSELLSVIDGEDVYISDAEAKSMIGAEKISTKKMLVICLGAFSGIETIIERRLKTRFGFQSFAVSPKQQDSSILEDLFKNIKAEDIKKYGFQAEFVGRLHTITHFKKLRQLDYMKIIKDIDSSMIKQLREDFKLIGVILGFEEEALVEIAKYLQDDDLGARQIKHVFSKVMKPYYLEIQEPLKEKKEVLISKADVVKALQTSA